MEQGVDLPRNNGKFAPRGGRRGAPAPMADVAIITLILTRSTGVVKIDDEFSTPMETWAVCSAATDLAGDRLDALAGRE